jgi:hypothetical protein
VSVHVTFPTNVFVVRRLIPGPTRWKFRVRDASVTAMR